MALDLLLKLSEPPSLRPERGEVSLGDKALPCPGLLDARCSFEDSTCPPLLESLLASPITISSSITARWEGRGPGWCCGAQISYLFILEVGCLLIIR